MRASSDPFVRFPAKSGGTFFFKEKKNKKKGSDRNRDSEYNDIKECEKRTIGESEIPQFLLSTDRTLFKIMSGPETQRSPREATGQGIEMVGVIRDDRVESAGGHEGGADDALESVMTAIRCRKQPEMLQKLTA